ncbi:unnamed protein product [Cyprideis torosa]|uniref:Uncharacterized protein n=1 Tax=Cyprideis torosa TaxID=163714 RepID=A0A7R8W8F6_9CRUS|nr:unnamed protein product [Cyprideis torosa]CAG0887437.1 unnamed protein product [Cyprideis torosa]
MKEEVDLDEDGRDGEVNDTSADVIEETFEREPLRKRSGRRNATAKRSLPQRRQTRSAISRVQKESGELSDPCEQCGKQFKTKTLLDRHIKGVHGPKVPCSICSHHCIPGREYDWHMKLHEKYPENRCPHCNKNYANPYVLNSHIKQAHSPEARIVCNICGNRYLESYMKRHMAMIHSKEGRALSCEHCGEVSRSSYALKVHYQKAHSDTVERKPCKVCGKTFLFQFQLKRHESVHESPQFPCEDCDKCFKRRDHLQNHRVIHQAPSALQCPECLRTYTHKRALKEHLNLHIGV